MRRSTDADTANELDTADLLSKAWGCEIHAFGGMDAIDFWASRDGRTVAVLELKTRSHCFGTFPTVWLSVRKWLALKLASTGLGVRAIFAVRFTDQIRWIDVEAIDARQNGIGGWRSPRARNDTEPVIEVPVATMKRLDAGAAAP